MRRADRMGMSTRCAGYSAVQTPRYDNSVNHVFPFERWQLYMVARAGTLFPCVGNITWYNSWRSLPTGSKHGGPQQKQENGITVWELKKACHCRVKDYDPQNASPSKKVCSKVAIRMAVQSFCQESEIHGALHAEHLHAQYRTYSHTGRPRTLSTFGPFEKNALDHQLSQIRRSDSGGGRR